jgi:hypothetical protein
MMNEFSLLMMKVTPHPLLQELRVHGWNRSSGGAVCGLCFGLISPIIGSIFTVLAWFTGPHWHGLSIQRYGGLLLFLTIPLLLLGGHCLDLMDEQNKAINQKTHDKRCRP